MHLVEFFFFFLILIIDQYAQKINCKQIAQPIVTYKNASCFIKNKPKKSDGPILTCTLIQTVGSFLPKIDQFKHLLIFYKN